MLNKVSERLSIKIKKYGIVLLGSLTWIVTVFKSGLVYSSFNGEGGGMGFWGANAHDGLWHVALAKSLANGSLQMPVFAGEALKNYHIGFDLFLALLSKITFIPVATLYFQLVPIVLSVLLGFSVYYFVYMWKKSHSAARWAVFFTYFGGSLGWLLGKGESAFWSQQAISTLINPPFALSLLILTLGFILIHKKKYLPAAVLFGILIEIKVYAGLLVIGGLLLAGIYSLIFEKDKALIKVFLAVLSISFAIFILFERGSQNLIIFKPFWFLETMMGLNDRLNYQKFYSAMLTYRSGHVFIKGVVAYSVAFIIFVIGNMGTRIIFAFKKLKLDSLDVLFYSIIGGGIIIPLLFLQKGTPWNTIQFFYYSLFLSGILAGVNLGNLVKGKLNYKAVLIILLTLPTTYFTLKEVYIPARPPAKISVDELAALNFLSKQPSGIVLTQPFNENKAKAAVNNPPRPLYLYASTSYVSAMTGHPTFLEDEINLDITGYNWQERKAAEEKWFLMDNIQEERAFLVNNNIKYIYWLKWGQFPPDLGGLALSKAYENGEVAIYKVN